MRRVDARVGAIVLLALAGLHWYAKGSETKQEIVVEVEAGKHDRTLTPVIFALPESWQGHKVLSLRRTDSDAVVPAQIGRDGKHLVWILRNTLVAGENRRYRITVDSETHEKQATVSYQDDGQHLLMRVGDKPVLRYNQAVIPSPDKEKPHYQRSGHIHPIYNPTGKEVTDDFAPDHRHQHGLMFAWNRTVFEGRKVDFWSQVNGTIQHDELLAKSAGPVFGGFTARLRHVDLKAPGGPKAALNESWRVRVYGLSHAFLFDLESTQNSAAGEGLEIQQVHYGALAIRGHRNWLDPAKSEYLTSEGKTRDDGNQTRPNWVDMHGTIAGKRSGITIMSHPSNFRSPQPVRLHPEKPYFCFAPHILGPFTIAPDKPYVSRFRVYVHDGPPDAKQIERIWQDYADPPQVRVIGDL